MTKRTSVTYIFIFVFLSMIHLSKQQPQCDISYFSLDQLKKNVSDIPLVRTKDPKDVMECTLKRACNERKESEEQKYFFSLLWCLPDELTKDCSIPEKCKVDSSHNVTYHHFLCMMANVSNLTALLNHIDCNYDVVCPVYENLKLADQTTALLPPPTRKTIPPTTTLPERTTAAAATTVLSPQTTPITAASPDNYGIGLQSGTHNGEMAETILLRIFLILSLIGHVVVFLYMWRQRRRDERLRMVENGLNLAQPLVQPMTDVMMVENGLNLAQPLVQPMTDVMPPECHSVVMHSANQKVCDD